MDSRFGDGIMDLREIDLNTACSNAVEFELIFPTDNRKTGIFISVIGEESDEYLSLKRKRINLDIAAAEKAAKRGKLPKERMAEERDEMKTLLLADCTKGWRGLTDNGQEYPFTRQNAIKLYTENRWIMTQVDEAVADMSLFLPTPPQNSLSSPSESSS
ncbi:MAG: hypothetical protein H8E42_05085 [Nitrospinae bacterium]|nr:hypothetical protein [Nitrospinota bacterium]